MILMREISALSLYAVDNVVGALWCRSERGGDCLVNRAECRAQSRVFSSPSTKSHCFLLIGMIDSRFPLRTSGQSSMAL